VPSPSPWYTSPEKIYFSLLLYIFLNWVYIDSSRGGLHLGTSDLYIWCFYQINPSPPLLTHFLSHAPLIFNSLLYSALYYIHIQMGCFNIFHSLTFSFSLPPP
jgi:hypothetical protein